MTKIAIPNGWYSAALASGAYVTTVPRTHQESAGTQLRTLHGIVALPNGQNLLFVTLSPDGTRFAGIGHGDGLAWEWDFNSQRWSSAGNAEGMYPVIYDATDVLRVVHETEGNQETGAQGWRYVDDAGQLVPAWKTYWDEPRQLGEHTEHGDITIGQGAAGGVVALHAGRRVRLDRLFDGLGETPSCRVVRFHRVGAQLAVAWYTDAPVFQACLLWLTVAELDALPDEGSAIPAPPTPLPPEEPMSLQAPNQIETVRRIMREHPEIDTLDEAQRGAILDYVVASLGGFPWGRKSRNQAGTDLNTDGLTFRRQDNLFEIYDVIDGTDGSATWNGFGPFGQGENGYWVPALPVTGPVDPPPPVDDTHQYNGGGNDTGTCDVCGQPRADAVHATPASKVPHHYDGGEQDTGECDVCGGKPYALLHVAIVIPGPTPDPDPDHEPEDPPVTHKFVGTGKFCSECGQGPSAAIHHQVVPPVVGDLAETNALLRQLDVAIAESTENVIEAIQEQTQRVEAIGAQLVAALKGGGGGILGGLLKKSPK